MLFDDGYYSCDVPDLISFECVSEMNVSAIVSAYYAKDFIKARLDNLMSLYPRPEVIVVAQRGSVEAEIAKTYEVTWILTPDIPTIYAAWNMAIKAANCEYITNANCDDIVYPGSYSEMAQSLNDDPTIGLVYGDEDQTDGIRPQRRGRVSINPGYTFDVIKKMCFVGPMPMWRKSLHEKYGYFNESFKVCGDYEFWLRIASHGEQFYHIDKPVGLYLNRLDSAEHRQPEIAQSEKLHIQSVYKGIAIRPKL